MNETRTPETLPIRHAMDELGFRPAILDVATMTIYLSSDGLAVLPGTLLAGFERGGFFYTRATAERAAREWI